MYTPRALFSRLFLQICRFILSLYIVSRLVTLSCEISVQSRVIMRQQSLIIVSEGKVWSWQSMVFVACM